MPTKADAATPPPGSDGPSRDPKPSARAPTPTDLAIAARVRGLRIAAGLSQEKVGEALGVTFQQIQKYENGVNRIGAGRLQAVAALFQVPVGTLLGADEEAGPELSEDMKLAALGVSAEGVRVIRALARIGDAETRRSIVALVEAIAGDDAPSEGLGIVVDQASTGELHGGGA